MGVCSLDSGDITELSVKQPLHCLSKQLGAHTRLEIAYALAGEEKCVTDVAEQVNVSLAVASKH
ncbi:winged helix-turn-helix domain-containing protein [Alicyclobacillus fastidiosus]|uniref:winged helix-turn-helix domain-containing protein n=1 Tax=Alicyclobacillus fastidiosus TaxID=392011 RepID=UPI0023E931B3|nr:hypothetical protein GCM10025859_30460 [Alicyclobacillus fastidiosus]